VSVIPMRVSRCPLIPSRFTKLKCWKGCRFWHPVDKRCAAEQPKAKK
jgi:hypothetical protein